MCRTLKCRTSTPQLSEAKIKETEPLSLLTALCVRTVEVRLQQLQQVYLIRALVYLTVLLSVCKI